MLYEGSLRLPRKVFTTGVVVPAPDPVSHVTQLKLAMRTLQPAQPHSQSRNPVFVSRDLATSTRVFLQKDVVGRPLQYPYDGPYKVIQSGNQACVLNIYGKHETIDRLNQRS